MKRTYSFALTPGDQVVHAGKKYLVQQQPTDDMVRVESVNGQKKIIPADSLMFFSPKKKQYEPVFPGSGAIHKSRRSIKNKETISGIKDVNLDDPQYHERKRHQNQQWLDDVEKYLDKHWMHGIKILALDDFDQGKKHLNTFSHLKAYGGRSKNFYLCNPKIQIAKKIHDVGGKSIPLSAGDCFRNQDIAIPPLNVIYLDYTCKWKKAKSDLEALFEHHERFFDKKGVILHLTLNKIYDKKCDYQKNLDNMFAFINELAQTYGYDVIKTRSYVSSKMYKLGIFIRPAQ